MAKRQRKRPLSAATLRKLAQGVLVGYVAGERYISSDAAMARSSRRAIVEASVVISDIDAAWEQYKRHHRRGGR